MAIIKEVCQKCGQEVDVEWDGTDKNLVTTCPECEFELMTLCSVCPLECPWNGEDAQCPYLRDRIHK